MAGLDPVGERFCVAVSGGADSLALCLVANDWAQSTNRQMFALTVNHKLRHEADQECAWLSLEMKKHGIPHHILQWEGDKPTANLQALAREARYELMAEFCHEHHISDLMLAHHQNDQAETFLMRLARGSGVEGLASMEVVSKRADLNIYRPLLELKKTDLISYLNEIDQEWIEDPSNENEDFDRVRVRHHTELFEELGLSAERISLAAGNLQRANKALQRFTNEWLAHNVTLFDEGYGRIKKSGIIDSEDEILYRALKRIAHAINPQTYGPRLERLSRLKNELMRGETATLMNCRWINEDDHILVCRENRQPDIPDGVFVIENSHLFSEANLCNLGENGWVEVLRLEPEQREKKWPKAVRESLPALYQGDRLIAVPFLNFFAPEVEEKPIMRFIGKNRLFY
jgi:tRNA(Ile)-lysidine synthase